MISPSESWGWRDQGDETDYPAIAAPEWMRRWAEAQQRAARQAIADTVFLGGSMLDHEEQERRAMVEFLCTKEEMQRLTFQRWLVEEGRVTA